MTYSLSRSLYIDAGHRITTHGSKCRNLHGHRYRIEAHCRATSLHHKGEQTDMILDFSFLKDEMSRIIEAPCDHGLIISIEDTALLHLFHRQSDWHHNLKVTVAEQGFASIIEPTLQSKLYIIPTQTTAECLARHWFYRLKDAVVERSLALAILEKIQVWETPNCMAEYQEE